MEEEVLRYLYLDFLLDPRFPKRFSDQSNQQEIALVLESYFDDSLDKKGFNFVKGEKIRYTSDYLRPDSYRNFRQKIVAQVAAKLLKSGRVFDIQEHPLFGRKCQVNSEEFIRILAKEKTSLSLSDGLNLDQDLKKWGVDRFKIGLAEIYDSIGGFFDAEKWVDFDRLPEPDDLDIVDLPQADRIVSVDQDSPQVVEITRQANELVKQLQTGNDLGNLTQEEASAAATEVRQIITAFEGSRVRARSTYEFARLVLGWIAEKGADALVGALATALLVSIAAYFGFNL